MWLLIVGQIAIGLIALASLCKYWSNYSAMSKRLGRLVPLFLLGLIALVTFFSILQTSNTTKQAAKYAGHIEELGKQFNILNNKFTDLQTKVNNDPILRQNNELLKEVKDMSVQSKAMKSLIDKPIEKANLLVTFNENPTRTPMPDQPLMHEITTTKQIDGTVKLIIYILNKSKVQAKKCTTFIQLCKECTFDKVPEGFLKASDSSEDEVLQSYEMHPAETVLPVQLTIRPPIHVPSLVSSFQISVTTRCENCIANPVSTLTIHIQK
jgi:hypothetical protein